MPSHNDCPVVVLGMTETGLGPARSLGRAGLRVIGVDYTPGIGFKSRYVSPRLCPHPIHEIDAFEGFLIDLAREISGRPVLLLTADDFALSVARIRDRIEPYYLMNTPDVELIERITDKFQQAEAASSLGIPIPRTVLLDDPSKLSLVKSELAFPVFVKGRSSSLWQEVTCDIKGFVAASEDELYSGSKPFFDRGLNLLAQEIVAGPDTNLFLVCVYMTPAGVPSLVFILRKLRQFPARFGVGAFVVSEQCEELADLAVRLFKGLGYRGIGSAEFKKDDRDGKYKLIELNPRFWQQNSLASACGMDFSLAFHSDLTGGEVEPIADFTEGIKWVNLELDLRSFQEYRLNGALTVRKWRESMVGPKVISDFAADDPWPFLVNARNKQWLSRYVREIFFKRDRIASV